MKAKAALKKKDIKTAASASKPKQRRPRKPPTKTVPQGKVGAPEIDRNVVVQKLREAFLMGCTTVEACLFADVSRSFYYDILLKEQPELKDIFDDCRNNPKLLAKTNLYNALKAGDMDVSVLVLSRTDEEYKPKAKVTHGGEIEVTPTDMAIQRIDEIISKAVGGGEKTSVADAGKK